MQCDEKTDLVKHTYLLDGSPKSHFYPNFLVMTIARVCTQYDEEENALINTPRKIQSLELLIDGRIERVRDVKFRIVI